MPRHMIEAVPSEVDSRLITVPNREKAIGPDTTIVFGEKRNLMQYTEDPTNARWGGTVTKTNSDQIVRDGITLTKITSSNFYHELATNFSGNGMTPFVVGKRYLASIYVLSTDPAEKFFWMRGLSNTSANGFGKRLLQPNRLTRVWELYQASSTSILLPVATPSLGFTETAQLGHKWIFQGNAAGNALSLYAGGMQIEQVSDTALSGIAGIGDSTMQGASGGNDYSAATEWMGYLEGILNCQTYNRGIGGNKLVDMDARWATDITPLRVSANYVIIQGGINDIGNGATLATCQGAVNSMVAKAKTDGFIPVLVTCTPFYNSAADPAKEAIRVAFNDWLKATFANVIDIAAVVADPYDAKLIRRTPGGSAGWVGDGTHYTKAAKRAIAERVAAWPGWDLPVPSPYQKVAATTPAPAGGVVLVAPDGTKYKLTVANGGALSATAV